MTYLQAIWNSPLRLDVRARTDVVFGGEDELVIEHPLRFVVQHSGGVQLHHLVVLCRQVMAGALKVSNLFTEQTIMKETSKQIEMDFLKFLYCWPAWLKKEQVLETNF